MLIMIIVNILFFIGIILYLKHFKKTIVNDIESRIKFLNKNVDNSIMNVIKMGTNIKKEVLEKINKK